MKNDLFNITFGNVDMLVVCEIFFKKENISKTNKVKKSIQNEIGPELYVELKKNVKECLKGFIKSTTKTLRINLIELYN